MNTTHTLIIAAALILMPTTPTLAQNKAKPTVPCHAISFDGGGRVLIPHSPSLNGGGPMTIEAWVRPYTASFDPSKGYPNLIGKRKNSSVYPPWVLGLWHHGEPYSVASRTKKIQANWRHGERQLPDRVWSHVAVVFDGKQMHFFVNGEFDGSGSARGMGPPNEEAIIIGQLQGGQQVFPGDVAAVRVSRVARYHEAFEPLARWQTDADTLLLMMFDEGEGERVEDLSGLGNHGKIEGATWIRESPDCKTK